MKISKPSYAFIIPENPETRIIRVVETLNPEDTLIRMLQEYILETGFYKSFVNFDSVRLGSVHPFAMMMLNEVLGVKQDLSIFPSITIADSNDNDSSQVLSDEYSESVIYAEDWALIEGFVQRGDLITSEDNLNLIKTVLRDGPLVLKTKRVNESHSVDFNIWSENKVVSSVLYDIVKHYLRDKSEDLHLRGLSRQEVNGRRSGDYNMEFGVILYGANITAKFEVTTSSAWVELPSNVINNIDVHDSHTEFHP